MTGKKIHDPGDAAWTVAQYMSAYMNGQTRRLNRTRAVADLIMSGEFGDPAPLVYDALLSPLFFPAHDRKMETLRKEKVNRTVLVPVRTALRNTSCPQHYLAAAVGCSNREYRFIARNNPNCPEEHEVYLALWLGRGAS